MELCGYDEELAVAPRALGLRRAGIGRLELELHVLIRRPFAEAREPDCCELVDGDAEVRVHPSRVGAQATDGARLSE
jgi:hypothetical protein